VFIRRMSIAAAHLSQTSTYWRAGFEQKENPTKLRAEDIAHMVKAILEMDDCGLTPELSIFATNPRN
jgi:hypothetical protein